jgi:hypothetical protein
LLLERGISTETIGDALAPRGTYEATFEGHRAARRLSGTAAPSAAPTPAGAAA